MHELPGRLTVADLSAVIVHAMSLAIEARQLADDALVDLGVRDDLEEAIDFLHDALARCPSRRMVSEQSSWNGLSQRD